MNTSTWRWPVVPISGPQSLDVAEGDVIMSRGLPMFHKCDTSRTRIVDRFSKYFVDCWCWKPSPLRFVAQLYGCHLDCSYCCVHREGVWGSHTGYSTAGLVTEFVNLQDFHWARQNVMDTIDTFHLMGGAPELYMEMWPALIECLRESARNQTAFHSDFTLCAFRYQDITLRQLQESRRNCLFAVNIKGWTPAEFYRLTRQKNFDPALMLDNLNRLLGWGIPVYITYTGMEQSCIDRFEQAAAKHVEGWCEDIKRFHIPVYSYAAISAPSRAVWNEEFVRGSG